MTGKKTKYAPEASGYIAPISIILIVFVGISVVLSIVLSFSKYNILLPPEFNGLENYQRLFSDTKFLTALTNTLKLLVYIVPLQTVLALLISALIASRRHTFLGKLTNIVIFIPVLSSNAVVGTIWKAILNGQVEAVEKFFALLVSTAACFWEMQTVHLLRLPWYLCGKRWVIIRFCICQR